MKICLAQTKPFKGDIQKNIESHKQLINLAISLGAEAIYFPELSLTGYEPSLAKTLAINPEDPLLDIFQKISDANRVLIAVGAPTKNELGISISLIIFRQNQSRSIQHKKYLHADEEPFFVSGKNSSTLINENPDISLAICYEISVPEHAENAFKEGAAIYIASVAKSQNGIEKALERLSEIANKYSMIVLMANCVGIAGGEICAGRSSVWNERGELLGQLNDKDEGVLILDTEAKQIVAKGMAKQVSS